MSFSSSLVDNRRRLEEWIDMISYAFLNLLEGNGDEAFFEYLESYGAFREPKLEA
ncbi:hypothetical protein [Paenibacillus elgii]|uniref:hypothetical protein n=1 Tax=Paenibacillus elgii TaxID=189691 RepID=UPI0002D5D18F|nr:hypothetical protein [Paenibacillus elgii]